MAEPIKLSLADTLKYSYRNFHARNVDYVCLWFSENLKIKLYYFDLDEVSGKIVSPHDHRYDFASELIAGKLKNVIYRDAPEGIGDTYYECAFRSPLLDGGGFTLVQKTNLTEVNQTQYHDGSRWISDYRSIHTLDKIIPGTALLIWQYRDVLEPGQPSRTFLETRAIPSLDGLYLPFTEDALMVRLRWLARQRPGLIDLNYIQQQLTPRGLTVVGEPTLSDLVEQQIG